MRVSDASLTQRFLTEFSARRSDMDTLLRQLASGKRVTRPSDDPAAAREALANRGIGARLQGLMESSRRAASDLGSIDATLSKVLDVMIEARDTGFAAPQANDEANDIRAIEVRSLRETLLNFANTFQRGRFVFSGSATSVNPFDAAGVYSGNSEEVRTAIDFNQDVGITLAGDSVFQGSGGDMFQQLEDLAVALENNDTAAITATLPQLDEAIRHLGTIRTDVGNRIRRAEIALDRHDDELVRVAERISQLEDIDIEEVAAGLSVTEARIAGLSATLQRIVGRSLFDVIG
ncbi:hypothetical protein ABI59_14695 [Acidobacteria bacterium Mor1]|nr:hypothetical protein ABI59_14695 [Acidobacteria bacterium Mor1]